MLKIPVAIAFIAIAALSSACSSSSSSGDNPVVPGGSSSSSDITATENGSSSTPIADDGTGGSQISGDTTGDTTSDTGDTNQTPTPDQDNQTNTAATGSISSFGTISASYTAIDDETDWVAAFFASPASFPASTVNEQFATRASDSCSASETLFPGDDDDIGVDPGDLSFVPESVSAGEVLTITSPAGTYASLFAEPLFGFLIYLTDGDEPVPGPIPEGLMVNIPGASGGFPAFGDVAMPNAAPVEFTVNGNTISWNGSGNDMSTISILMSAFADGDFQTQVIVECELVDDGSHQIAAGVLPAGNVEIPVFFGTRSATRFVQNGTAVLVLEAESEGFLSTN